jgi:uncharacterized integral membrane protein
VVSYINFFFNIGFILLLLVLVFSSCSAVRQFAFLTQSQSTPIMVCTFGCHIRALRFLCFIGYIAYSLLTHALKNQFARNIFHDSLCYMLICLYMHIIYTSEEGIYASARERGKRHFVISHIE